MKGITTMEKEISSCDQGEDTNLSGNDGAAEGQSDPTASVEQALGQLCVKNTDDKFCMIEMTKFGQKHQGSPEGELTCDTPAIKDLVGLGCCYGSWMAMAAMGETEEGQDSSSEELAAVSFLITKCGGSLLPCSAGAIKDVAVVKSSLTLSADGLTKAALEKPAVVQSIKKNVAASIKVKPNAVVIEAIEIKTTRHRARSLAASTAEVKYSVMVEPSKAAAIETAIKAVDDTALTSALSADAAFSSFSSLSADQSTTVSKDEVAAKPEAGMNAAQSAAPTFAAALIAAMVAFTLV